MWLWDIGHVCVLHVTTLWSKDIQKIHMNYTYMYTCIYMYTHNAAKSVFLFLYQLTGNFMKNTQHVATRIKTSDIKLSLSADVVSWYCTCVSHLMCSYMMFMYMYFHHEAFVSWCVHVHVHVYLYSVMADVGTALSV